MNVWASVVVHINHPTTTSFTVSMINKNKLFENDGISSRISYSFVIRDTELRELING